MKFTCAFLVGAQIWNLAIPLSTELFKSIGRYNWSSSEEWDKSIKN